MRMYKSGEIVTLQALMTVKSISGDTVHTSWLDSNGHLQEGEFLAVELAVYDAGPNSFEPDFEI